MSIEFEPNFVCIEHPVLEAIDRVAHLACEDLGKLAQAGKMSSGHYGDKKITCLQMLGEARTVWSQALMLTAVEIPESTPSASPERDIENIPCGCGSGKKQRLCHPTQLDLLIDLAQYVTTNLDSPSFKVAPKENFLMAERVIEKAKNALSYTEKIPNV
jgi:hypothetical protein